MANRGSNNKCFFHLFRRDGRGFTLVETLIAVFILSVGILISLMFFVRANVSTQLAREITRATAHANSVFEEMMARETLEEITGTDWTRWAGENLADPLSEETVTVAYPDPEQDPLPVDLKITWRRQGREHYLDMTTEITKP